MTLRDRADYIELRRGWRLLLGATLGASVSTGGLFFYTSGVFFSELNDALGWTRSELSLAHLFHTTLIAILSPFVGSMMDRHGVRRLIIFSLCAQAAGYTAIGLAPANLTIYLALQATTAMLGAAATPLGFSRVVSAHFDHMRGFALGIVISGLGVVAIVAPVGLSYVVEATGWRGGYLTIAAFVAVIGTSAMLLMGRARDEPPARAGTAAIDERPLPLSHFLRRKTLWLMIVAFVLPIMFGSGYLPHFIALLRDRGIATMDAGVLTSAIGVALLFGRLCTGWLIDRIFAPWVSAGVMALFGAGLIMLASEEAALILPAALAIGFALGAELDILAYVISRYFGIANFGKLYGLVYGITMMGGGFSALLLSQLLERSGSYELGLWVSTVAIGISAVLFLLAPPFPGRPRSSAGGVPAMSQ